jgi:uncharacterized protein
MPANLSPEYHRAEERLRTARAPEEKLAALEDMLRVIPKHKGTDHMQADLKSRIAKLRKDAGKRGGKAGFSYLVSREGAGQIALAGPPNAGKSSLLGALTRATPEIGDYAFTTREPLPGMMRFEDVAIQLVDLPPLSERHTEAWVFDLIRYADLVWIVLDGSNALEGFDEVRRVCLAHNVGLYPSGSLPSYAEAAVQKKAMIVLTGLDKPGVADSVPAVPELLDGRWRVHAVSAVSGRGLSGLPATAFAAMEIMRVYTKQPGKPRDPSAPFTLPPGSTVADLAGRIHKDLAATMTFARVWGTSAFDGQAVQKDHLLADGDVVEIHA